MMPVTPDLGLGFSDKRNRNPNWTDHEIMRFLDILQEEKVLKDLMAQRNKQVIMGIFKMIQDYENQAFKSSPPDTKFPKSFVKK